MGAITLEFLESVSPQSVENDMTPNVVSEDIYLYKDIKLDLTIGNVEGNIPTNKPFNTADFGDLRNIEDIKQSILNIMNTRPGQKLLNPSLGLDLSRFCFEPVNNIVGDLIARAITAGLPAQEPRISVVNLVVIGNPTAGTYNCSFNVSLKDDVLREFRINGMLDTDGFKFN